MITGLQMSFLTELFELMSIATSGSSLESVLPRIMCMTNANLGIISVLKDDLILRIAKRSTMTPCVVLTSEQGSLSYALTLKAIENGKSQFIEEFSNCSDIPDLAKETAKGLGVVSLVYAPLKFGKNNTGAIILGWQEKVDFTKEELEFCEMMGIILGIVIHNIELIDNLKTHEADLQKACRAAIDAQESERKRLSRELHDEIGQAITAILLRLKILQDETDIEVIQDRLNGVRYITSHTLDEVRRLATDLRPAAFDDLGLIQAIRFYIESYYSNTGLQVSFQSDNITDRLPGDLEIALYRAVQEGLTNVSKHARASRVDISLKLEQDLVTLIIEDDGKGLDKQLSYESGIGLIGMQERVKILGGHFQIESEANQGVKITITLPTTKATALGKENQK